VCVSWARRAMGTGRCERQRSSWKHPLNTKVTTFFQISIINLGYFANMEQLFILYSNNLYLFLFLRYWHWSLMFNLISIYSILGHFLRLVEYFEPTKVRSGCKCVCHGVSRPLQTLFINLKLIYNTFMNWNFKDI
jgi:hypothetical protein